MPMPIWFQFLVDFETDPMSTPIRFRFRFRFDPGLLFRCNQFRFWWTYMSIVFNVYATLRFVICWFSAQILHSRTGCIWGFPKQLWVRPWDCTGSAQDNIGCLGVCIGHPIQTRRCPIFPWGSPKQLWVQGDCIRLCQRGTGIWRLRVCIGCPIQTRRCPIFPWSPKNNSECALGMVLGYPREGPSALVIVFCYPREATCGFVLGAQYKRYPIFPWGVPK